MKRQAAHGIASPHATAAAGGPLSRKFRLFARRAPPSSAPEIETVIVGRQGRERPASAQRLSPHRFAFLFGTFDFFTILIVGLFALLVLVDEAQTRSHRPVILGGLITYAVVSGLLRVYSVDRIFESRPCLTRVLLALLVTFMALLTIGAMTKSNIAYSRLWFFWWAVGTLVLVALQRTVALAIVADRLTRGACLNRALLVSLVPNGMTAAQLGIRSRNRMRAASVLTLDAAAQLADCRPLLLEQDCDTLIVECPWDLVPDVSRKLAHLSDLALDVFVLPAHERGRIDILRISRLGSVLMFQAAEPPLAGWNIVTKRILDVAVAVTALIMLAPAMMILALAIRFESAGPFLFRQVRLGFNGALIEVWKFRSMYTEATDADAVQQTSRHDLRVTRIGRLMRRTSLDELPQLFNVVQGSMSIVGPRPHALSTTAEGLALDAVVNSYAARHRTKPGITGWAQVNGLRGELDSAEKLRLRVEHDLDYIENWSLLLDIKIIGMTMIQVLHDPRAY